MKKPQGKAPTKRKKRSATHDGPGQPPLFKSAKELQEKIDAYFASCHEEVWNYRMKREYASMKTSDLEKLGIPSEDQFEWVPDYDRHGEIVTYQVKPYTIVGLAQHLGTTRQTLLDYQERDGFFDTIKNAKVKCEAYTVEQLFQPKIAAGVIFNLKNNYGYTDKIDHTSDGKPMPQPIINVHTDNSD
jgi:hypothetical protein